jgi:glucose/arabinose dehydrogenase/predicted small secreted protein
MSRLALSSLVASLALITACETAGAGRDAQDPGGLVSIGSGLRGPSGLTAALFATGPTDAAAFALDPQGRLWVSTAAYQDQGKDGVYMIERQGAAPIEVISALPTPLGLVWIGDRLFVSSTRGIDAYGALSGSRFGEHRAVLAWPTPVGENNNLALSPDGNLLLGISAPCDHCQPASPWSAAIVSLRPDGSNLEVFASGIRAPVGLAYYPGTGDLFVSMDQRDDLGRKTPGDWLGLVRKGQDWQSPGCYGQGGGSCAGVPQPVGVLDKHAAVGGVAIVTGQLGQAVGSSALVSEWAVGKVQRVALRRAGAGYSGEVLPFLTGVQNPLPLLATPDRALLVGDWKTGKIYRVSRP